MSRYESLTIGTLLVEDVSAKVLKIGGDPQEGTASTQVTATAAELNQAADISAGQALMTPGTGISTGVGTICDHAVTKVGDLIKTEILIDLTGLNSGGAIGDIIGKDGGTANCHIGQITAAVNGTIIAGRVTCLEAPAGGDPDVDFYGSVDEATGAQDALISGLTGEELLINHGDWAISNVAALTAMPDADGYLYMVSAAVTDADYTAGILLVELWGN